MPQGGYRRPSNPAPVSGPGALSRRTDGGPTQGAKQMTGGKYGESKQLMQQQQAAPMAAAPKPKAGNVHMPQGNPITALTAPTQRPNEPLTAGAPFGAGPGPEILAMNQNNQRTSDVIAKLVPFDDTGQLSEFYTYLISRGL